MKAYPPENIRKQHIEDSFMVSNILSDKSLRDIKTLCAAETPSSIFASLPYVLMHGYNHVVVGHERSANTG